MAARGSGRTLGNSHRNGHRKVSPLKLGAEHLPFPCSLRELVLDRYGEPPGGGHVYPMQLDELLEYLKNIDNFSLSPWVALASQTEAIGDPATPSPEQIATLRWLGKALELWEKQSPLEGRVAAQVRRLKPLCAALALTEPDFLQPGAHPMHQLLDNIQKRAIGWQARLDRVGAILEQQVTKAVDDSRMWFNSPATDLARICADFSATAERDQARAQRMTQRIVEAEAGKAKTAAAKREASGMINAALEKHPVPEDIASFIKGPWYTSAQLLLLKFGAHSDQWQKMSGTTQTLLDSFQLSSDGDEARRQHIFEVVTQLPKEMRRWLLSLHHDTEAVNEAMGLVEFAHLRILRRQPMTLVHVTPIVVEGEYANSDEPASPTLLKNWHEGQWFSIATDSDGTVRAQLVLKVDQSQQLVFANLAGIKVLQLGFSDFDRMVTRGKVKVLSTGANFSLCLAHAVGIDSVEVLNALASALAQAQPTSRLETAPPPTAEPPPEHTHEPALEIDDPPYEPTLELELEAETAPQAPPNQDAIEPEEETPEWDFATEGEVVDTIGDDHYALPHSDDEPEVEVAATEEPQDDQPSEIKHSQRPMGFLIDQAEEIKARGGYRVSTQDESIAEADTLQEESLEDFLDESSLDLANEEDSPPASQEGDTASLNSLMPDEAESLDDTHIDSDIATASNTEQAADQAPRQTERRINLAMGAWLGFHDGETPLMARLALYDLENDHYLFVNRQGVKIRQVTRLELLNLIDNGLVDILETNSNFRSEVTEVRKNLDQ